MSRRPWQRRWIPLILLLLIVQQLIAQPVFAQDDEDDLLDVAARIYKVLRDRGTEIQADMSAPDANAQTIVEERPVQIVKQLVAVGAALVNMLPDADPGGNASDDHAGALGYDCGAVDGIALPCWEEYLGDREADESLPYYPYAKRPNGCSVPGAVPGANDTITLFFVEISFTDICNAHDRCYYTLGTTPSECNGPFRHGLRIRCEHSIAGHAQSGWDVATGGFSVIAALEACYNKADAMAIGVIGAQLTSHAIAQQKQRDYLERVNVYVEQERARQASE